VKKPLVFTLLISFGTFIVISPVFLRLVTYLHPIVLAVVLLCIIGMVLFGVLLIRKETIDLPYPLFMGILTLYTVGLLILLFFRPNGTNYHSLNLIPFSTVSFYLSGKVNWLISFYNLAANIGLFIPYGIYLSLKSYSLLKVFLVSLLTIACLEILQFLTHRGSLDIDDLMLNMLGVYLGCFLFSFFKHVVNITMK
jgi:glycopeptide antibiotics resistance protein